MINFTSYPELPESKLQKWFNARMNLLLIGGHGVGKTAIIKNFFEKAGLKYAIFSGATLDPWTDLVGIPVNNGDGTFSMATPSTLQFDTEAIFIDEYNRSHSKVRNALMELTQFGSINGKKFPNLKVVWAAINDDKSLYDVEEIDPAQMDRFQVHYKLDYAPNKTYFQEKYGEEVAAQSIEWWDRLSDDLKIQVSPRRLDYALDYSIFGDGDLRDIMADKNLNVNELAKVISCSHVWSSFVGLVNGGKWGEVTEQLSDAKIFQFIYARLVKNVDIFGKVCPYIGVEKLNGICSSNFSAALCAFASLRKHEFSKKYLSFDWWLNAKKAFMAMEDKIGFISGKTEIGDKTPTINFDTFDSVEGFVGRIPNDTFRMSAHSIGFWANALKRGGDLVGVSKKFVEQVNEMCVASLLAANWSNANIISTYHFLLDPSAERGYNNAEPKSLVTTPKANKPVINGSFKEEELC